MTPRETFMTPRETFMTVLSSGSLVSGMHTAVLLQQFVLTFLVSCPFRMWAIITLHKVFHHHLLNIYTVGNSLISSVYLQYLLLESNSANHLSSWSMLTMPWLRHVHMKWAFRSWLMVQKGLFDNSCKNWSFINVSHAQLFAEMNR